MSFTQVKPFDQSIAGTKKYYCLANVRAGYRIGNKYSSAWIAWLHTQQHTDPIPLGVAVPVFWELWLKLDGDTVQKNYGHIAVSLPDGRVWTDGRVYANVTVLNRDYLGGKGRYVGWGESVNDVKVIESQGGSMTEQQAKDMAIRIGLLGMMTEKQVYDPAWLDYQWKHIQAEPFTYPTALAKQIYEGQQWQLASYKQANYDKDVKAAYEKGKAEAGGADYEEVGNNTGLYQRKK